MSEKIPIIIILLILSVIDIKKREVPHLWVLTLFLYVLLIEKMSCLSFFWACYCFIGLGIVYFITRGGIGGGDIKLLAVLAYYLGSSFPIFLGALTVTSGVGFLAGAVYHRKMKLSLPLVPFIFIAFLLVNRFGL